MNLPVGSLVETPSGNIFHIVSKGLLNLVRQEWLADTTRRVVFSPEYSSVWSVMPESFNENYLTWRCVGSDALRCGYKVNDDQLQDQNDYVIPVESLDKVFKRKERPKHYLPSVCVHVENPLDSERGKLKQIIEGHIYYVNQHIIGQDCRILRATDVDADRGTTPER